MGKRKVLSEEEIKDMVLLVANDVLGIAVRAQAFQPYQCNLSQLL